MTATHPFIIRNSVHSDHRGTHIKFFGNTPEEISVADFSIREVFMTVNRKHTIRGLYFQDPPVNKLVSCLTGGIRVNLICIDPANEYFGKIFRFLLLPRVEKLYVPGSWACGYLALADETQVLYLADEDYHPEDALGINPFDGELAFGWGDGININNVTIRESDLHLPTFSQFKKSLA
jgi:dTDP-4-dehydrorhamnose 3,5-epimerase